MIEVRIKCGCGHVEVRRANTDGALVVRERTTGRLCECCADVVVREKRQNSLHLYKVDQGEVTNAKPSTRTNGRESILVAATSRAGALKVAEAYDRGAVAVSEIEIRGRTIDAAWIFDRDTRAYV